MPETSIVIRTYNEEKHLGNLLKAIKTQDYNDYEIIVVDSDSRDKTLEIAREFGAKIIEIPARDFTFGYSLNRGCQLASGKYLVFASAHVLPTNNQWLGNLIEPLKKEAVALVYGRQEGTPLSKFSERMDFQRLFGATAITSSLPVYYANNANSAIKKSLWEKEAFNEYLFGLEDIDWARKMSGDGYLICYEPKASVYHIHEEKWHQVFNRYRREAIAGVRIGLKRPPQAGLGYLWLVDRLVADIVASFPNWSKSRVEEIVRFRYYQWKGSRTGWRQGKTLSIERDKDLVFYPIDNNSVVIKGKGDAGFEKFSLPELKPGDVLLSVDYVGICRTDLEVLEGTLGYYRDGVAKYPIVPGHEFSGTIVRVGSNNKFRERWKPGQKVVGECILSRDPGDRREVGVINYSGAYANYIIMPGDNIHVVPEGVNSKEAALAEPVAVVLRAIRRIKPRLKAGAKIAVLGAGPIGNLCSQALLLDNYDVSIFDRNEERLNLLKDKVSSTGTAANNLGAFDIIIECTGSKELLEKTIKESRSDATIMLLGFPYGDINYNFEDLVGQEKFIVGSVGSEREDFDKALKILPQLDLKSFTETVLPLEDFKKAWELHKTGKHLKILLKP